jgi:hypothetical protein
MRLFGDQQRSVDVCAHAASGDYPALEHLFVRWYNHGGLVRWRSSWLFLPILLIE